MIEKMKISFLPYMVFFKGHNSWDIQCRSLKKHTYCRLSWAKHYTKFERNQTIFTAVSATSVKTMVKGNNSEKGKLIQKQNMTNLDNLFIHLRAKFRWNWLVNDWENEGFVLIPSLSNKCLSIHIRPFDVQVGVAY